MPIMYGQVGAPSNNSINDTTTAPWLFGKAAEGIVAELHGAYYTEAYRSNVYWARTAVGGTIIPLQVASMASTFTFLNPTGSGKNMELITYAAAFESSIMVVSDASLFFQTIGGAVTAPTVVAAITATRGSTILGTSGSSVVTAYSAATLVGAITAGPILFGPTQTQSVIGSAGPSLFRYDFRGELIVPPGTIITVAGNAAQTSAASQILYWAEIPI